MNCTRLYIESRLVFRVRLPLTASLKMCYTVLYVIHTNRHGAAPLRSSDKEQDDEKEIQLGNDGPNILVHVSFTFPMWITYRIGIGIVTVTQSIQSQR